MELTKLHREIISRVAMAVLGLGLLYGGYKCLRTAYDFNEEARERQVKMTASTASRPPRRDSGAGLPGLIGAVLVLLGAPFALASVLPTSVFARIMGPPNQIGLHEQPESPFIIKIY
jgi:hypothetical protein